MEHKIYLKKTIIWVLVSLFITIIFNQFYMKFIDENGARFNNVKKEKVELINVGSSHGKFGIYYQNNEGINLAESSQGFYYDYKILKKHSPMIKENTIVIIPVSIFSFYQGRNLKKDSLTYMNSLDFEDLIGVSFKDYYSNKYFGFLSKPTKVIKYFVACLKNKKIAKNTEITMPRILSLEEKEKEAIKTSKRHTGKGGEDSINENPKIGREDLKEIINFLKEVNARPVFVTTPQSLFYNKYVSLDDYEKRIYKNLKIVLNELDIQIPYLDYSHDQRFENNLELFSDDDHLNRTGAIKFTEILITDLKTKDILKSR